MTTQPPHKSLRVLFVDDEHSLREFMRTELGASFYFGGTSLLIVVVVVMDFIAQIQAHLMSHQYESLLKKANLKGSRTGLPGRG